MTAAEPPDPSESASALVLTVAADASTLTLKIRNVASVDVTLWEQRNSWGWPTLGIDVYSSPDSDPPHPLRLRPKRWTRNFPSTVTLAPGDVAPFALRAEDLDPDMTAGLESLVATVVWVRGRLSIPASPEAVELGVWCGSAASDLTRLDPPQRWLDP